MYPQIQPRCTANWCQRASGAEEAGVIDEPDRPGSVAISVQVCHCLSKYGSTRRLPSVSTRASRGSYPELFQESIDALQEAVRRTGGEVHRLSKALDDFTRIVEDFRASYVLRYTPKGVERRGWHALTVRLTWPGTFTVRARAGYTGG